MNRRIFIKNSALTVSALGIGVESAFSVINKKPVINKLPLWKGFNILDYFSPNPPRGKWNASTEEDFRWMRDWGFNFVRLPLAYPRYIAFDRAKDITPDDIYKIDAKVADEIEDLVVLANKYNLHVSLNLHRAPGYCINAGFKEPFNLWKDKEAQQAFYYHWGYWGKRFANYSPEKISFDLLNEPAMREDMNNQYAANSAVPGELYREVAKNSLESIRKSNPNHLVIADGNNVGNTIIEEITDLPIAQSCRGYFPHYVSHYKAPWAFKDPEKSPLPVWPGKIEGKYYDRTSLEEYYKPWIELVNKGVGVHCGECGCWNKTPHDVFIAWFSDVTQVLTSNKIGFALWNFRGDFGILDSGRTDCEYTDWFGHKLDKKLLDLIQS